MRQTNLLLDLCQTQSNDAARQPDSTSISFVPWHLQFSPWIWRCQVLKMVGCLYSASDSSSTLQLSCGYCLLNYTVRFLFHQISIKVDKVSNRRNNIEPKAQNCQRLQGRGGRWESEGHWSRGSRFNCTVRKGEWIPGLSDSSSRYQFFVMRSLTSKFSLLT